MITIIGILVGAIIVGFIWIVVHFNQEISEIRANRQASNHITYSQYYKSNSVKSECERATETIRELVSEREQTKDVIRELDGKLEEGLLLIEAMDKRGIRGGKIPHAPTPSEEDWNNWKNSLCTECLEKIEKEKEDEERPSLQLNQ